MYVCMHILSPIVTPPSGVAGSSCADSKKNSTQQPKPIGDSKKKPQKQPAGDSQKKPQTQLKLVRGCLKRKPTKQHKRAPAAKKSAKKSKDPEPAIPDLSLPSSSGIPSTPLFPQSQVTPPQLSLPTASLQLPVPNASLQLPVPTASPQLPVPNASPQLPVPTASPQLPVPTASPQLPVPTASPQLPVPNATQTPPPDNPKNTERKKKGKNSGGNDYEKILMSLFVEPEYRLDKAADGYYKYAITHPLFNVTGNECKTDKTARQSVAYKVIKRLIEKHKHKIPLNN